MNLAQQVRNEVAVSQLGQDVDVLGAQVVHVVRVALEFIQ